MSGRPVWKVGLLGTGAIGQVLAEALDRGEANAVLAAVADQDREKAEAFTRTLRHRVPVVSLDELVAQSDLIVEAASQGALAELVPRAIAAGKELLVLSVGGLLGHEEWFQQAAGRGCRIHVPSGAIAGLDGLRAAAQRRMDSVVLTSRKPVRALQGTKYVVERGMDLDGLTEETVLFEGPPEEACRAFPTTSNVAASLRLAVGRKTNVCVRVVAVPGGNENVHEIRAEGEFGRLHVRVENVPSEANPRTSKLAALSALATLEEITGRARA